MPFADSLRRAYRVLFVVLVKVFSVAMILVGVLIALCVIADRLFHLGWGYPWWSLIGCVGYIALSFVFYRATTSFVAHVDRKIDNRS
jgi:hypothetical protein